MTFAAFSAAVFGIGTTFARLAYDGGANPLTVVVLRTLTFVIVIAVVVAVLRRDFRLDRRTFVATLWMAVTLIMVSLGYQGSVAFIPVSLAALVFYTFPLMVSLIAVATGRDRLTGRKAIAVPGAFVGLALTLGPSLASLDWRGIGLALLAALGMALTLTFGGEATRGRDPIVMSVYTNVWMLIVLAIFATATGGFALPTTGTGRSVTAALSVTYVIAYVCWYLALGRVQPVRLAALFNIEPLVTLLAAWLVLGERLSGLQFAGAALVLASIVAISARDRAGEEAAVPTPA